MYLLLLLSPLSTKPTLLTNKWEGERRAMTELANFSRVQHDLSRQRVIMASIMASAAYYNETNSEGGNALQSVHEDGGANDADGRPASDMARLRVELDKNNNFEHPQAELIRSTGSRQGRVNVNDLGRIKRSSSENHRFLRRLNSDPGKNSLKRTELGTDEDAANRQELASPGSSLRKFFEAFHLLKRKMPLLRSMVESHEIEYIVANQRSQVEGSIETIKNTIRLSCRRKI